MVGEKISNNYMELNQSSWVEAESKDFVKVTTVAAVHKNKEVDDESQQDMNSFIYNLTEHTVFVVPEELTTASVQQISATSFSADSFCGIFHHTITSDTSYCEKCFIPIHSNCGSVSGKHFYM